jgi:homoserine kinase type II
MSVYTTLDAAELAEFLTNYAVGDLLDFSGISEGIENTNYFVNTTQGHFVLTLFERQKDADLEYFLELMTFLHAAQLPTAEVITAKNGKKLLTCKGKSASLVQRLQGKWQAEPSPSQMVSAARALAQLHLLGKDFPRKRDNDRGLRWWLDTLDCLESKIPSDDYQRIKEEIRFQKLFRGEDLPRGVIHADLFRDNVLFDGENLSGIIDFYYSCHDLWLYDLAVMVNDWCAVDNRLDLEKTALVLNAYHQVRPLLAIERGAWPYLLRAAALRFWLSRLTDWHFPRLGSMTHCKDPNTYKNLLLTHQQQMAVYPREWPC